MLHVACSCKGFVVLAAAVYAKISSGQVKYSIAFSAGTVHLLPGKLRYIYPLICVAKVYLSEANQVLAPPVFVASGNIVWFHKNHVKRKRQFDGN